MVDGRDGEGVDGVGLKLADGVAGDDRAVGENLLVKVTELRLLVLRHAAPSGDGILFTQLTLLFPYLLLRTILLCFFLTLTEQR